MSGSLERVAMLLPSPGIPLLAPGGASEHFRGLAEGFAQAGLQCRTFVRRLHRGSGVPSVDPPPTLSYALAPRGHLPGFLRKRRAWDERIDAAAMRRWLARELRRWRPDVLYERMSLFSALGCGLRLDLKVPWILELNAPLAWEACWFEGLSPSRRLLRVEEKTLQSADAVVVVSGPLRDYAIRRGVIASRIWLIPNGTRSSSSTVRQRGLEAQAGVLEQPGAVHRPFVLGYEGTFKPWQGMRSQVPALRAFAEERCPGGLRLELWGDGPDRAGLLTDLRSLAPQIELDLRGWGSPLRDHWSAAWVPLAPWPPPSEQLSTVFGEDPPERYFSPLKEAAAAATGLPVWSGGELRSLPPSRPRTWAEIAEELVGRVARMAED